MKPELLLWDNGESYDLHHVFYILLSDWDVEDVDRLLRLHWSDGKILATGQNLAWRVDGKTTTVEALVEDAPALMFSCDEERAQRVRATVASLSNRALRLALLRAWYQDAIDLIKEELAERGDAGTKENPT